MYDLTMERHLVESLRHLPRQIVSCNCAIYTRDVAKSRMKSSMKSSIDNCEVKSLFVECRRDP